MIVESVGRGHPAIWSGAANPWIDLSTQRSDAGKVFGMSVEHQVGVLNGHAALWSGTAQSLVDLHPSGTWYSQANATAGNDQVGYAQLVITGPLHAGLWHGSAQSFVDLNPPGAMSSSASSVVGGLQGGGAVFPTPQGSAAHAGLWTGSAHSFIDLHPGQEFVDSGITGMVEGQQVGAARRVTGNTHAALWRGTPQTYLDLAPPNSGFSILYGTCGSAQVGYANTLSLGITAGIWFGTPESFVPLAPYLPAGYYESIATSVAEVNGTFYVGGYATNATSGSHDAFLWVGVPAPASGLILGAGLVLRRHRRA